MPWRDLDPQALELAYNPRLTVGDPAPFFAAFQRLSDATRGELACRPDIRYGPGPLETLDLYPAASTDAPVHLFIVRLGKDRTAPLPQILHDQMLRQQGTKRIR